MTGAGLEHVLRHDRATVLGAIAALTALAWGYVLWLADGMAMPGADASMSGAGAEAPMGEMMAPSLAGWSLSHAIAMWLMWMVMMVGMMLPSIAPMALIYARVARQARERARPFASTGWFVAGYLVAWAGFSLAATAAQWALERAALLLPMTMAMDGALGGAVLIAAGLYQWSSLKETCLAHCQAPLVFIQRHGGFRPDPAGALRLGARHGLYCIGCCWGLMAVLFAMGIMNILWIAGLALLVLVEKLVPSPRLLPRLAGASLLLLGLWTLA